MSDPLRVSLTLPGSASLGAFQAGAVAALAEVVDELEERGRKVHLDAVGGASAGSIVALFLVHCRLNGLDTAEVLHRAWVERVDADLLSAGSGSAPLGFDELRTRIPEFLAEEGSGPAMADRPIALHIGLTNLLGLTHSVETMNSTVSGLSFADWAQFELEPGGGMSQILEPAGRSPLDHALASASHPGAFVPAKIDRSSDRETYESHGVDNFPESGTFWFTDGGLVESKPIGRVLELARRRRGTAEGVRIHLVVDPRSSGPSGSDEWCDPDECPTWLAGVRRAISILPTQALQDDLRGVEQVNERLDRLDRLAEKHGLDAAARDELADAVGLLGKERVDVEVISPLEIAEDRPRDVSELLAGDFIGAFGGFLSQDLRASDFRLGWRSARSWLRGGLDRHGIDAETIAAVESRVDSHPLIDADVDAGGAGVGDLGVRGRYRLARLAGRIGKILIGAATPDVLRSSEGRAAS